jgi:hypothetical protein
MMFQGTYQSPFYRKLHQVLHEDLELRQRLQATAGLPDADTLAALDRLNAAWLELGCLETQYRSAAPTMIAGPLVERAAPDLSKGWN